MPFHVHRVAMPSARWRIAEILAESTSRAGSRLAAGTGQGREPIRHVEISYIVAPSRARAPHIVLILWGMRNWHIRCYTESQPDCGIGLGVSVAYVYSPIAALLGQPYGLEKST